MRADDAAGGADVRAGAIPPVLPRAAGSLIDVRVLLLAVSGLIVGLAVDRAAQSPRGVAPAASGPPAPTGHGAAEGVLTGGPNR